MATILRHTEPGSGVVKRLENTTSDRHGWRAIDPEDGEKYFFPIGTWEEVTDEARED
jgi:hypothetical protein